MSIAAQPPCDAPSAAELVDRASRLAPTLAKRAARAEADRRVPRESIDEIVDAGLARALQPARFGGFEAGHRTAFDITTRIAAACGSTGWCISLLNIHDWWLAAFPEEAQHDVWRDSPDQNIAAMAYPTGKAAPADGGFSLSGRWSWVSGVDHCDWAILSALIFAEAGPPTVRNFLLPRADYTILDTWHNAGLKGSGSNDIVVEEVFVPAHRTLAMADFREGKTPGGRAHGKRIYQLPMLSAFPHALSGPPVGIARGALQGWTDWTRERTSSATAESVAESPPIQITCAEVEAAIDAAEALCRRNLAVIESDTPIDEALRARAYASFSFAAQAACRAVDRLLRESGAHGMLDSAPLQRCWRDVHAAAVHIGLSPRMTGQLRGRALLGLPRDPKAVMY